MKQRLVLFDIDGTILLSGGAGRRAITTALGEAVGDVDAFAGIRFDGKTDPQKTARPIRRSCPSSWPLREIPRRTILRGSRRSAAGTSPCWNRSWAMASRKGPR